MLAIKNSLCFLLVAAASLASVGAFNVDTHLEAAHKLQNDAVFFEEGHYHIRNAKTHRYISFNHGGGNKIETSTHAYEWNLETKPKTTLFILSALKHYCMSAAWIGGRDSVDLPYACEVGKYAVPGTVEHSKQFWIGVPAKGDGSPHRNPSQYAPDSQNSENGNNFKECIGSRAHTAACTKKHKRMVLEPRSASHTVRIYASDHINDMKAECILPSSKDGGLALGDCNEDGSLWTFIKA